VKSSRRLPPPARGTRCPSGRAPRSCAVGCHPPGPLTPMPGSQPARRRLDSPRPPRRAPALRRPVHLVLPPSRWCRNSPHRLPPPPSQCRRPRPPSSAQDRCRLVNDRSLSGSLLLPFRRRTLPASHYHIAKVRVRGGESRAAKSMPEWMSRCWAATLSGAAGVLASSASRVALEGARGDGDRWVLSAGALEDVRAAAAIASCGAPRWRASR
jgi:hypothetical protein